MKQRGIISSVLFFFVMTLLTLHWSPFSGGAAYAKSIRLSIGAGHPHVISWVERVRDFFCVEVEKRVKERTEHEVKWVHAYGGTVAKLGGVLEAVQGGSLDLGFVVFPFEPTRLFIHNFCYFVPFGAEDITQVSELGSKVFDEVPYLKNVFEEKYNQKFLGGAATGGYVVVTNFPFKKIADLKGRKIGGAGPNLGFIKAAGGTPVVTTFNEAYNSVKTGVYEAGFTLTAPTVSMKLYEVSKYHVECGLGAVFVGGLTVNMDRWMGLPADVKDIIMQVGKEYTFDHAKAAVAKTEKALAILKEKGMNLSTLPFEERVKWANMMPNIPQGSAMKANEMGMPGSKILKAYIAELEKSGHKFPRRWVVN